MIEAIYQPKGKALEYSPLACNLYTGCSHGCKYCYCPLVLHKKPEEFFQPGVPRKGILEALARDAAKYKGDPRPVLLCFTSDPYQPAEEKYEVTCEAIEIMGEAGLKIKVLTKNPVLAMRRDSRLLLETGAHLGTTLVCANDADSKLWEPGAPETSRRINALLHAHNMGIPTWVSFEPVVKCYDTLKILENVGSYADIVKIGRWNYHPDAHKINWQTFLDAAMGIIQRTGLKYYIKNELWALASAKVKAAYPQTNIADGELDRKSEQRFH